MFAISGFKARNIFAPSITEEAKVTIKVDSKCEVEPSDGVPREIRNCQYSKGDTILIHINRNYRILKRINQFKESEIALSHTDLGMIRPNRPCSPKAG